MATNKIALVTGGSRGLGKNMAIKLAEKGINVILTYNSKKDEADAVVAEIEKAGLKAAALQLSAGDIKSFDAFFTQLKTVLNDKFGTDHFDFLINNAGFGSYGLFAETTEDQFDELLNVHFKGVFFLTQKALPIINDGGRIINITSFDVIENRLHGAFVDYRAHVGIFRGIADRNFLYSRLQLRQKYFVDALVNNGARASRTLLALEAECGLGHAFDGGINVGVGVHDDGILASHFEDGALDPDLAGSVCGCALVDVESNFARPCESDVSGLGMRHHCVSEAGAGAGTEIHHAFRHAALFEQFHELCRDGRRVARWFQNYRVATHDGSHRHARHDGAGEIPRRNYSTHAQRNVGENVSFSRHLYRQFGAGQSQSFASVVFGEVNGLGDIGVGFRPVLAYFKNQPGAEFKLALAQHIAYMEEQAGALFK